MARCWNVEGVKVALEPSARPAGTARGAEAGERDLSPGRGLLDGPAPGSRWRGCRAGPAAAQRPAPGEPASWDGESRRRGRFPSPRY